MLTIRTGTPEQLSVCHRNGRSGIFITESYAMKFSPRVAGERYFHYPYAMAVLPIKIFPDPILRQRANEVVTFDTALQNLVDAMVETMYASHGIGLAAPQIGVAQRIAVVDVGEEDAPDLLHLINPIIVEREGKTSYEEGCLSIPGFRETVSRSKKITVEAYNVHGERFSLETTDLKAICIQHELDHLDGILFIDHLSRLKREHFKRWQKRQQEEESD